jgi:hypothetical protein
MKQKRKNGMLHAVFSFLGFNHTTSQPFGLSVVGLQRRLTRVRTETSPALEPRPLERDSVVLGRKQPIRVFRRPLIHDWNVMEPCLLGNLNRLHPSPNWRTKREERRHCCVIIVLKTKKTKAFQFFFMLLISVRGNP